MNRLWLAALGCGVWAVPAGAASPDPKDLTIPPQELSRARVLVQKLGSQAFRDREQAQDDLAKMGRLARPVLVEALQTDPNPEVRSRTVALLPRAEAADLQARIDTFLADAAGKFDHDLPAWELFRKHAGADKAARDLYVELLKSPANLQLLVGLGHSPQEGGRAVADRRLALYTQMNPNAFGGRMGFNPTAKPTQPGLIDVALLLLAETAIPSKDIPKTGPFVFVTGATFVQQAQPMAAINNPAGTPHAAVYKAVLVKWLDSRTAPEDLNNIVHVAMNLRQFKEATALLRRVVTTDGVQGYARGQALMYLVQRSGAEEQAFLKTLLKNDAVVTQVFLGANPMGGANQVPCLLRDVALAMLVTQTKQDLKAYGFEFPPGVNINPANIGYGSYAFTSDEKREAGFKKWAAWEAAQKQAEPKK
jgi:hypothetical protein